MKPLDYSQRSLCKWEIYWRRMVREAKTLFDLDYTIVSQALHGIRCISGRVSQKFIEMLLKKPLILEGGGGGQLDFHIDDLVEGIARTLI